MIVIKLSVSKIDNIRTRLLFSIISVFIISLLLWMNMGKLSIFYCINKHYNVSSNGVNELFPLTIFSLLSIPILILFKRTWKKEYNQIKRL